MARIDYISMNDLAATLDLMTASNQVPAKYQADLQASITAASRAVDGICQRVFDQGTASEARYYSPDRWDLLEIDDLHTFVSLQCDDNGDGTFVTTWTNGVDFDLVGSLAPSPDNAAADGFPWDTIRVRRNGSYVFLTSFTRSIKITGTFGWAAVPDDVVRATTLLASRIYQISRNAPLDVIPGGDIGMIRLGSRIPNVMMLLSRYQRHKIGVA